NLEPWQATLLDGFTITNLVLARWSILALILATAAAHRMPIWKALLTLLLTAAPVAAVVAVLLWVPVRVTLTGVVALVVAVMAVVGLFGSAVMITSLFNRGRLPVWLLRLINRGLFRTPPPGPPQPQTLRQRFPLIPFPHALCLSILLGLFINVTVFDT